MACPIARLILAETKSTAALSGNWPSSSSKGEIPAHRLIDREFPTTMLDTTYRAHSELAAPWIRVFYDGKVKAIPSRRVLNNFLSIFFNTFRYLCRLSTTPRFGYPHASTFWI